MKQRKYLYIIVGLIALLVAAGAYWWNAPQPAQKAQLDGETATVSDGYKQPEKDAQANEQKSAAETKKLPVQDTLAMTFEGTKTYIVAGSVNGTKNGSNWTAELRNEAEGKISQVEFKQDGQKLMTRNDGGAWRPVDEMDRTIFQKLMEILEKQ